MRGTKSESHSGAFLAKDRGTVAFVETFYPLCEGTFHRCSLRLFRVGAFLLLLWEFEVGSFFVLLIVVVIGKANWFISSTATSWHVNKM